MPVFLVLPLVVQGTDEPRTRMIPAGVSEQTLDTLSIIEESFSIYGPDSQPLEEAFYRVDYINARITLRIPEFWQDDSLRVEYLVFPVLLSAPYFHKDPSLKRPPGPGEDPMPIAISRTRPDEGLFHAEGLSSSGSITRGISLGNRQDVALNSAMNLQLTGSLSEDIDVLAVISDQDIPFQPDGTTRQIQDFDKVFIQLSGMGGKLTAGDFEIDQPPGYFMKFSRRAQGGMASYTTRSAEDGLMGGAELSVTASGAIAKGKYARNVFTGGEGNQGPYKLTGAENESFIVVLAGTERVYIDGEPMTRGMDNDYVIDYNMAELTFTSRQLITKNSRIAVEFEYAERNYARSMFFTGATLENEKASVRFNFFSEQDHKNQPLFQELTDERINKMSAIGDSLHKAFDWNVDSTGFKNDRVMYRLTDSLGFDSVFVYSVDPDVAVYRLGFSYVGEGNGNYRQVNAAANGRVFEWVAPLNGLPQGSHEPIIQLVTPKQSQMMVIGGDYKIQANTRAGVEFSLTNRDLNRFSALDNENNVGYALRVNAENEMRFERFGDGQWRATFSGSHEISGTDFSSIERYRPVEFERDWNLDHRLEPATENASVISAHFIHPENGHARYRFQSFFREGYYQGIMNRIDSRLRFGKNRLFFDGSYLLSDGRQETAFYRHQAGYSRQLTFFVAGFEHHTEHNQLFENSRDLLAASSFYFDQWTFFISNPDTAQNRYRLYYKTRADHLPHDGGFAAASRSSDYGLSYDFMENPNQRLRMNAAYRELSFKQEAEFTLPQQQRDESTFIGRVDYFSRWLDGVITSSLFYESGSGMEREREYIYMEVPPGQGVYTWIDYNENGIMELDEFEIAQYPDQANFIRVFVPTDNFIRTYSTVFSHTLNIDPARSWRDSEGWRKFASRFSNRLVYRIDKKNQGGATLENFNPFFTDVADSLLISLNSSIRNSLFFNRSAAVFGMELIYQDSRNKMLLSNGFETRINSKTGINARWNITRQYAVNLELSQGIRENRSEFFLKRNFRVQYYELEPTLSYQHNSRFRISGFYGYSDKENQGGMENEKAVIHSGGVELRYSFPGKGNINGRYQLSDIDYPHDENTPVAFEMLEGLRPGTNHLWTLTWQQNLNQWLQLNLSYHGRKPPEVNIIHTGSMQLRAFF